MAGVRVKFGCPLSPMSHLAGGVLCGGECHWLPACSLHRVVIRVCPAAAPLRHCQRTASRTLCLLDLELWRWLAAPPGTGWRRQRRAPSRCALLPLYRHWAARGRRRLLMIGTSEKSAGWAPGWLLVAGRKRSALVYNSESRSSYCYWSFSWKSHFYIIYLKSIVLK